MRRLSKVEVKCDRIKTGFPICSRCPRHGIACENLERTKKPGRPRLSISQKQEAAIERERRAQFSHLYPKIRSHQRAQRQKQNPTRQLFEAPPEQPIEQQQQEIVQNQLSEEDNLIEQLFEQEWPKQQPPLIEQQTLSQEESELFNDFFYF